VIDHYSRRLYQHLLTCLEDKFAFITEQVRSNVNACFLYPVLVDLVSSGVFIPWGNVGHESVFHISLHSFIHSFIYSCVTVDWRAVPWLRWSPGFALGSILVVFVIDNVALGQVFLRVLLFSPVHNIPPSFSLLIYHPGDEQYVR
jgi:hypothetical protein